MLAAFSESANGISLPDSSYKEGETLLGQRELQRIVDRERKPYQAGGYAGLPDIRFMLMDDSKLETLFDIYDNDPWVGIACTTVLDAALGGSITITDSFEKEMGEEQAKVLAEWRGDINVNLCKAGHRYKCSVGFMPWMPIPNAFDVGEVKPLPFCDMMTFYAVNAIGDPMWAFFDKPRADMTSLSGNQFAGHMVGERKMNVYVTTWSAPTKEGGIRSIVASLIKGQGFVDDLKTDTSVAASRMARPFFVTSWKDIDQDVAANYNVVPNLATSKGDAAKHQGAEILAGSVQVVIQARGQLGNKGAEETVARVAGAIRGANGSEQGPMVSLDPGQQLESQTIPQQPKETIQHILLNQQTILTRFGVPPSMIQAESARGRLASGSDQNAALIFRNSQMALKQDFVKLIKHTYNVIHAHSKIQMYLMHQPLTRHVTKTEVDRAISSSVKIVIPGMPPEDVIDKLYRQGELKYSAKRRYTSTMHAIPLDDLNEEPTISLEDLITDCKYSMQSEGLESQEKLQKQGFKEQEKMQEADIQSKETIAKNKPKPASGGPAKKKQKR
jgi:hypothetical protein